MKSKIQLDNKKRYDKKGSALVLFYLVMVILSVLFAGLLGRSIVESRAALRYRDILQTYYLAESGIDQAKRELFNLFETYYISQDREVSSFTWFDDLTDSGVLATKYPGIPTGATLASVPGGTYTVTISDVGSSDIDYRDVTLTSSATFNNITKIVTSVVRYALAPAKIFDYSYFVCNSSSNVGGGLVHNGDVRTNGDLTLQGSPTINGNIYASFNPELGTAGTITGNFSSKTISQYRNFEDGTAARPTNPTADGLGEYEGGYDGNPQLFENQEPLELPYLGDLTYYKQKAVDANGTITQGGVTVVDNVYNGNKVLIGTAADPLVINGPVVVTGDVLIKGYVTGQGTIYTGRNVHVLGDVQYKNLAVYPKPDTNPDATYTANAQKDFLCLAARGSVVIGNYTTNPWKNAVKNNIQPPVTEDYKVDETDNDIGYISYYDGDGDPHFNGDYTALDGGSKTEQLQLGEDATRRFYESSYGDTYVNNLIQAVQSGNLSQIDAVLYTDHLIAARLGNCTINGSMACRDEALMASGNIVLNHDIRVKTLGTPIFLPRALDIPHTLYFRKD